MIIFATAVALAAAQPAAQTAPAPAAHGEAMTHQGHHCCCCPHGDQAGEDGADHRRHGAAQGGHQDH